MVSPNARGRHGDAIPGGGKGVRGNRATGGRG